MGRHPYMAPYSFHLTPTPGGYHTHSSQLTENHSSSRWRTDHNSLPDITNIAQQNIPISTAAPTHHVSILNTSHILFFSKKAFKNFLGPFPGASGANAHHFRIPLLPLHTLYFFPTFLPHFFHHLTQPLPTFRHILITHLIYFFSKKIFKIFGPFPGAPEAHATNSVLPYSHQ